MVAPFAFKQFIVKQDQCAMKIGTDGVLLGAWVKPTVAPFNVLDIGTGTGVISLMLAQRFANAEIDAVEIDDKAYEQATENFENSDWGDRMFCYHASFQEFFEEIENSYDLIISNPPFFKSTQKSPNDQRNVARFEDSLPFEHLLHGASKLLSEEGLVALIIPFDQEDSILEIAAKMYLFPQKITRVKGTKNSIIKRSLLILSFSKKTLPLVSELIIEKERHQYTEEYLELVSDFYLNL